MSEALEEITQIAMWLKADSLEEAASFVLEYKDKYDVRVVQLAEQLSRSYEV